MKIDRVLDDLVEVDTELFRKLKSFEGPQVVLMSTPYGGKLDWLWRHFVFNETGPILKSQYDEGDITDRIKGSGNLYIHSIRKELESQRARLNAEMDLVNTALNLCTPEVEKAIQLQRVMEQLNKLK